MEGYQAWEVLLKLFEPDFSVALQIATALGFDVTAMVELLPVGLQGMKSGLSEEHKIDQV